MPRNAADYTFFWSTNHVNGWASQWYRAPFTATVNMDGADQEIRFLSNEHWMMLQKALLFSDMEVVHEVISIEGTSESDCARVQALGRKVKNFKKDVWVAHRERVVTEGTIHKFRQNADLRAKLFATGETMLVEASPVDRIWGIGYTEANATQDRDKWGLNLLGKALVEARRVLREEERQKQESQKTAVVD
ncbi:hypothetical protein FB451DRAFT_88806 [Mycena latifolia]|nr:hypothetical protein FB451DRAFT_88806 [Mycena latifolia]